MPEPVFPAENQHRVAPDQVGDLSAPLADGQLRRKVRGRGELAAAANQGLGGVDSLDEARQALVDGLAFGEAALETGELLAQAVPVGDQALVDLGGGGQGLGHGRVGRRKMAILPEWG